MQCSHCTHGKVHCNAVIWFISELTFRLELLGGVERLGFVYCSSGMYKNYIEYLELS